MMGGKYKNSEHSLAGRRRRWRGEIEKGEKPRGEGGKRELCGVVFSPGSQYHTEGGHMKLANVPTCPFPTYRVSLAACFGVAERKETEKTPREKKT